MPQKRYKPEQIIHKLREADVGNKERWDYLLSEKSGKDAEEELYEKNK